VLLVAVAIGALLAAAYSGFRFWAEEVPVETLLKRANRARAAQDYAATEELCLQLVGREGPTPSVLLMAGEAAAKQGRLTEALGYYAQIPPDAGKYAALGCAAAGDLLLKAYHASAAEAQFRRALQIDPTLGLVHDRLAYLLGIEGRRFESFPHLFTQLRANCFSMEPLILLGNHEAPINQTDELKKFREATPDDLMPLLGEARLAIRYTHLDEAKRLLKQVLSQAPRQIEAQAELGRVLLAQDDPEFGRWLHDSAPAAEAHPDVWMLRGLWAKRRGAARGAARCFWEALRRDPLHQAATYQLAQSLKSLGDAKAARWLSDRAAQLQNLARVAESLYVNRDNLGLMRSAAELTESLGCIWEACAWRRLILDRVPHDGASRDALQRLAAKLENDTPLVLDSDNPAKQIDLTDFPLPRWDAEPSENRPSAPELAKSRPRFANVAAQAGIDFSYANGSQSDREDRQIFRDTGGGVAVLDYDGDGWPDIYLTQGCRHPLATSSSDPLDRLYRNRGDGTFEDVTARSLLAEDRYSQGVAVGDFNNDGFPDLYVANIGANRLFVNQQDGTFRDISEEAGIGGEAWTTSCVLADLNGDGLCDIYDVNYIQGEGVYERTCPYKGRERSCAPTVFQPQPDCFWLNLGDGRFADQTAAAGLTAACGNGLGAVAGDLDGSGRLSVFVADDQDANLCFFNETAALGEAPKFVERGLLSGLAYDAEGKALACMGIAAADANEDGKLDLYVTNFFEESNTLYLQLDGGMFVDATGQSGLQEPSYRMLGFGTQFLDADLDGHLDLIVANGHVEDLTFQQVPFEMRPQYFRGLGAGRFQELPAAELGEFFQGEHLGRGLARIDFNRDGREDFVVSHLDSPVALVANTSTEIGHFLAVQLRGVQSSRDAVGARVTIEVGGRTRTGWLLGGDGYQASNQRQLIFGLGADEHVEKLSIRWPSGLVQEFADLAADQELIFVEGSPRITPLPSLSPADLRLLLIRLRRSGADCLESLHYLLFQGRLPQFLERRAQCVRGRPVGVGSQFVEKKQRAA